MCPPDLQSLSVFLGNETAARVHRRQRQTRRHVVQVEVEEIYPSSESSLTAEKMAVDCYQRHVCHEE